MTANRTCAPVRAGRRRFLGLAALPLLAAASRARGLGRPRRIGYFHVIKPGAARISMEWFRRGLADKHLSEPRDYVIDYVWEARIARVPARMEALVATAPDLIVAVTTPVAVAAARATRTLPIVFQLVSEPVASGLVENLARPGRNVTGVTNFLPALSGKVLELAREIIPSAARLAVMWNPANPAKTLELGELEKAAAATKVSLRQLPVRNAAEIERAFAALRPGECDALVVLADTLTHSNRQRIAELALAARLPSVFNHEPHVLAGGLASYSPDYQDLVQRAGDLAGRILTGADPAVLPVERPTRFSLAVNLRTAKALGVTIPPVVLLRANRVID